jgi:hypothetical protein
MKKNHNFSIFIEKEIREIREIRGAPLPTPN